MLDLLNRGLDLAVDERPDGLDEEPEFAKLRITPDPAYHVGYPGAATLLIDGDADAPLKIVDIERIGNDTRLTWNSVPGTHYGVEAFNPVTGAWESIKSDIPAHPSAATTTDTVETTAARVRIYRVSR